MNACTKLVLIWALGTVACAPLPTRPTSEPSIPLALQMGTRSDAEAGAPTVWIGTQGERWLIVSDPDQDALLIHDADSGELLRRYAESGSGPGQLREPRGLYAIDDLLFVVDRGNTRVQVFRLPEFHFLGEFGNSVLQRPASIWIDTVPIGWLRVYVTDDQGLLLSSTQEPKVLDALVQVWQVRRRIEERMRVRYVRALGEVEAPLAFKALAAVHGDRANLNLLIAESETSSSDDQASIRRYTMDGLLQVPQLPVSKDNSAVRGLALWACADGSGYWLAAEQDRTTARLRVHDRQSLQELGSASLPEISRLGGIWLQTGGNGRYADGALYLSGPGSSWALIDWHVIADALSLRRSCEQE